MQRPRPRFIAWISLALGAALLLTAATRLHHDHAAPTDFGAPTTPTPATATHTATTPTATPPSPSPSHLTISTSTTTTPATAQPARLTIPTLNVTATITPVSTTNGVLGVPDDPATLGWWSGSVLPGAPAGSTVIDGHVDSAATGIGALFHISELRNGDPIQLTTTQGHTLIYHVYARHTYQKQQGLPADLFTTTGPPRLVLITCGGPFDHAEHSYLDNITVFATPTT